MFYNKKEVFRLKLHGDKNVSKEVKMITRPDDPDKETTTKTVIVKGNEFRVIANAGDYITVTVTEIDNQNKRSLESDPLILQGSGGNKPKKPDIIEVIEALC